ncbi:MAG: cytochrome c [Chromatiales bacterium]|jgi:cytochrome c553
MKNRFAIALACALAIGAASVQAGDAAAGKQKSQTCAACHGPDGNSPNPIYPHLAGQYETYLLRALKDYKSGARKNAIMTGMVAALSDDDLEDLAAYYASQTGLFNTVPD